MNRNENENILRWELYQEIQKNKERIMGEMGLKTTYNDYEKPQTKEEIIYNDLLEKFKDLKEYVLKFLLKNNIKEEIVINLNKLDNDYALGKIFYILNALLELLCKSSTLIRRKQLDISKEKLKETFKFIIKKFSLTNSIINNKGSWYHLELEKIREKIEHARNWDLLYLDYDS